MKNKILILCAGIILLLFLILGTYAWYSFFLRASGSVIYQSEKYYLKEGDIVLSDNGLGLYDANAESINDADVKNIPDYNFTVKNTKNDTGKYILYIEDIPVNLVNDGCTEKNLLQRSDLKYELKLNGKVVKSGYMQTINDNILDEREIKGKSSNSYSLKIYIHDQALDWFGKHYHYRVTLGKKL